MNDNEKEKSVIEHHGEYYGLLPIVVLTAVFNEGDWLMKIIGGVVLWLIYSAVFFAAKKWYVKTALKSKSRLVDVFCCVVIIAVSLFGSIMLKGLAN